VTRAILLRGRRGTAGAAPAVLGLLPLLLVLALAAGCRDRQDAGQAPEKGGLSEGVADLYFPGPSGLLTPERRSVEPVEGAEAQVRMLVEALLAGPEGESLARPFPEGVTVTQVMVDAGGTAYVDLTAPEEADPPSSGSMQEMQTVYSLVNTITLNVSGVRRVALLWNGVQRETFAGHLDTSRPLPPDPRMVGP
jgi:hypothetical protein